MLFNRLHLTQMLPVRASLGSMLFGKQNPLDGYALQRSLPPLSERWDAMCRHVSGLL